MYNILVFIWEWKSEYAFFQEFLKSHLWIEWEDMKSNILYKKKNTYVLFWHPVMWNFDHKWWDCTLFSDVTYIQVKKRLESQKYLFKELKNYKIYYLIFTDKDKINSIEKIKWAEVLIKKWCSEYNGEVKAMFAEKEIETWFLAWFSDIMKIGYWIIKEDRLNKYLKIEDLDTLEDTYEILQVIIKWTDLDGNQEYIWREFWKYIDIEQAKNKSKSFKNFIEIIESLFI
ncbi:MAG: hypothetical protein ACD_3C00164G0004 [uncultured bacterium (gcode 4)]|uniref:Uncharacterized protein n=1 Tax=uncultured bacterium (gcode 4) TaxID=1234023 RepID=K2G0P6_9BACT|nr:MAG: hypothetical protein ACD_3C00164G0004 [uncultured bacterium (gcode 4)]